MTTHTEKTPLNEQHGYLIDTTKCIGCRSCQVSCKQWNELEAEKTQIDDKKAGLQMPTTMSAKTFTVITYNEVENPRAPGGLSYVMAKRMCMHCNEPACASACPVTALHKTAEGPVVYDADKCIGCRYCMWACPWGVPTAEWDSLAPKIQKCTMCYDRNGQSCPDSRNGTAYGEAEKASGTKAYGQPICTKACPPGALKFGKRGELLEEARARIKADPARYHDGIYGEHEAGGTNVLYLSPVPFEQIGLPRIQHQSYTATAAVALGAVPAAVLGVGAALGATYAVKKRADEVKAAEAKDVKAVEHHHPTFEPISKPLWTGFNKLMAALMAFGGISMLARFALGLGGSTGLNDTYAWGLWIVFDLVWIAVAAGAFATAGLIYVFRREDLYSIGRSAVLMGLLSYSFVTVTLLADLGLPWHFWQLGLQAPEHSAMFEVSWCVGLYVTVLAAEFLPVLFEGIGLKAGMETWKKWAPIYVVFAMTLFVYLMSRNLVYAAGAAAVFGIMAYAYRTRPGEKPVPVMLAIAAVTLSSMHQSSLGSLFLLMPDKLNHLWWSPVMPVYFFLSSIAAGTALMVVIEMWVAKAYSRPLRTKQLAAMGKVALGAMAVYLAFRLGDVALRGQLGAAFSGPKGMMFLAEIVVGGLVPVVMLASAANRENPRTLFAASLLGTLGIVFNRINVVVGAMTLPGAAPGNLPLSYTPSVFEWGISIGLIAATIFLYGVAVRRLPVLPKADEASSH
ncbi:MAG: polysulfide reductase NrfD [Anaeromyxobacteraceae bacterium]